MPKPATSGWSRVLATLVVTAAALWGAGAPAHAAEIIVYEHASFRGRSMTFDGAVDDLSRLDFNDRISSIRVERGSWEVCEHKDFGGRCEVLYSGVVEDLSNMRFNDSISSLRPVGDAPYRSAPPRGDFDDERRRGDGRLRGGITLFEHKDYRGRSETFYRSVPDLREVRFDDASSVNVGRAAWELCDRAYFRGRCRILDSDISNLGEIDMNDRVLSLRPIERGGGDGRPYDDDESEGITIYTQRNFDGSRRRFYRAESNLADVDFNDVASSLRVGSRAWQICEHADFRGRCVIVERDIRDLSALGLGNRISSIRPAEYRDRDR